MSRKIYTVIFLLREPSKSLKSILDLKPHWDDRIALCYYQDRLAMLEKYARLINSRERSLFITHEQLINQTDLCLDALRIFLETKEGFSEQYEILKTTGMRGIGDSSNNIKAGRIILTGRQNSLKSL